MAQKTIIKILKYMIDRFKREILTTTLRKSILLRIV